MQPMKDYVPAYLPAIGASREQTDPVLQLENTINVSFGDGFRALTRDLPLAIGVGRTALS